MKKRITVMLLCCLLLLGCAPEQPPEETTTPTIPTEVQATEPAGCYDPDSPLEQATNGAVRCYPLGGSYSGMYALADGILLFSCDANSTELTLLTGEDLVPAATKSLNFDLFPQDARLQPWEKGISFYDPKAKETVVLDAALQEVSRIGVPSDLIGTPLLSYDRSTLYYCTATSLRALDVESGISRCLKEMSYDYQELTGILLNETILSCVISDGSRWQTLFLSTDTGSLLDQAEGFLTVQSFEDHYYTTVMDGSMTSRLFGTPDSDPRLLGTSEEEITHYFLPEDHSLVTFFLESETECDLYYYDLTTCLRSASLHLTTEYYPWCLQSTEDGIVWFLNYDEGYSCTTLYRWDTTLSPTGDNTFYGRTYFTPEEPDYESLEACRQLASEIGDKYGVEILIYKNAAAVQPWDYDLEYEYLTPVIQRELELLDQHLANYPDGFLETLSSYFEGIRICIVRSLTGTAESGSLDTADGIQFMDGYTACIALSARSNTEYALYHEMCHLIDTVVISQSGAYDRWDQLNPKNFEYDYDYISNQSRVSDEYLQESNRSFIDTYSMSFPKEDRARIMEYAMTPGNESYFVSLAMQSKLKLLCEGIREAFGLRKSPETFLWEQYLNTSLAYTE